MSMLTLAALFAALVDAALKGSLVLLAALAATRLMKRRSAAARHLVWVVALASMLALPLASRLLPAWRVVPVPAPLRPAAGFVAEPDAAPPPAVTAPRDAGLASAAAGSAHESPSPASSSVSSPTASTSTPAAPFDWKSALLTLWVAGAALLALRLAYGIARVWWMQRRAVEITDEGWVGVTDSLARKLRVHRMVTLLREAHAVVPMTWGIVRPVVLLPADAEAWDGERRTVVLAHELAHVRRWDTATQWIAHLALALFWFNPLVWMAARQMREEREHACDDAVLSIGTVPVRYADHLLDIVRSLGSVEGPAAALAMARKSQFEGRLLAILDGATPRGGVSRGLGLAALVVAAAAVLPLGALRAARPAEALAAQHTAALQAGEKAEAKEKGPLASIVLRMGKILDLDLDVRPPRDTTVKTSFRGQAQTRTPAPALPGAPASAASAHGAASSPYAATAPQPPAAPAPPPVTAPTGVDAVASALGVEPARAAAMLQEGAYADVIRAAANIASSPEKAAVLLAVLRRPDLSPTDLAALLRVAGTITADPEKRDVLKEAATRWPLTPTAVRRAFFTASSAFTSSPERRDVLLEVLARSGDADVVSSTILCARAIVAEPERRDVLVRAAERATPAGLREVVLATRELVSSPIRRDLLIKVLGRRDIPAAVLRDAILAVAEIPSSPEKRDVLVYAATHQRLDAAAREAYLTAANSITASPERVQAIGALVGGRDTAFRLSTASTPADSGAVRYSYDLVSNHGEWNSELHITDDHGRVVQIRAKQVVRGDEPDDIRSIKRGGSLMVEETRAGRVRRAELAPAANGALSRSYRVDGQARAFDDEAQRWMSSILREYTRER